MRFVDSIRVGSFLAYRSVKRSSKYVSVLIVVILTLIFLNLVAIGGLLIGMIKGSEKGYIEYLGGSVIIKPLADKLYVQRTDDLVSFAKSLPEYLAHSPRISSAAKIETRFRERKKGSEGESVSAKVVGMDPVLEAQTTLFPSTIIEGRFLRPDDRDKIVLGSILAGKRVFAAFGQSLKDVYLGDKILVHYGNGVSREYEVVGIMKSKFEILDLQAYVSFKEMQQVLAITDDRVSEIAIKTSDYSKAEQFRKFFFDAGYDQYNLIQSWSEGLGAMMSAVYDSIGLIADIIGSIGLAVGGITIFILIFINAVSKRRFIGVLKASGVTSSSIICSFVFQGIFYTFIAILIGMVLLYGFMIPYLDRHPIDFAFADGIIYVTESYVLARIIVLFVVSVLSGLVPAYMIAKENTLNAILGR